MVGLDLEDRPAPHRFRPDDQIGPGPGGERPARQPVILGQHLPSGIGVVLEFGVDRPLHEEDVEGARVDRCRRHPPCPVDKRHGQRGGAPSERQGRRPPPPGAGRAQERRGAEHHEPTDPTGSGPVGDLDERGPAPLGVPEPAEGEAAEDRATQLLAAHPHQRRRGNQRPAENLHQPRRPPNKQRHVDRQIGRQRHPADRCRRVGEPQPVDRQQPVDKPSQPQAPPRMTRRADAVPREDQPRGRRQPGEDPQIGGGMDEEHCHRTEEAEAEHTAIGAPRRDRARLSLFHCPCHRSSPIPSGRSPRFSRQRRREQTWRARCRGRREHPRRQDTARVSR